MSEFNIDYTGKDYFSLLSKADAFAQSILPEWTSRDDNDINWATVKIVAYLVSIGMFYIDLGVNEQDPYEVQVYANALRLAKKYGMPVKKYVGGVTSLSITVKDHGSLYTLSRGEEFFYLGQKYILLEDLSFPVGVNTLSGDVQFGEFERYRLGVSDATEFQKFLVDRDNVQDKAIRIFIDETGVGDSFEEWVAQDTLVMSYEEDKHFRLVLNEEEKYEVYFGDNGSGKIPLNGALIDVEVIKMPVGYEDINYGNLPVGNINLASNADVTLVEQLEAVVGGGPREDILSIGRALPQWISTANRAVATQDYRYLCKRVAGVEDASVVLEELVAYIYVIPEGGGQASSALLNKVRDYLLPRHMEQVELNVLVPVYVTINFTADITVASDKIRSVVKAKAEEAIEGFLDAPMQVGVIVKLQEAYCLLSHLEGIEVSLITEMYRDGEAPSVGNVNISLTESSEAGIITINATGGII
jgi:hypothetical protein